MNREESLKAALTEDKNTDVVVASTLKKDIKAIGRAKREAQDALEEAEEALEDRMSSDTPLDKSTVEVLFKNIKTKKNLVELYEEFENTYFSKTQN